MKRTATADERGRVNLGSQLAGATVTVTIDVDSPHSIELVEKSGPKPDFTECRACGQTAPTVVELNAQPCTGGSDE